MQFRLCHVEYEFLLKPPFFVNLISFQVTLYYGAFYSRSEPRSSTARWASGSLFGHCNLIFDYAFQGLDNLQNRSPDGIYGLGESSKSS